jgi:hypothetical protein
MTATTAARAISWRRLLALGATYGSLPSAVSLLATPASAQEPTTPPVVAPVDAAGGAEADKLRAQRLFDEALALRDQGRWQDSCARFRESMAADAAVGTLLNVAGCSVKEGKLTQAIEEYERLEEINTRTRDPDRQRNVQEQANTALKDLKRRLPRLVLKISPASAAARVIVDGKAVPIAAAGEPLLVDAGAHVIEVEAPGFARARAAITIKEGEQTVVPIDLLSGDAGSSGGADLRIAGWVVSATGAGALAGGAILFVLAGDRASRVRDECGPAADPPSCPLGSAARANAISSEGEDFAIGSYSLLAIGGAALVTGVALIIADSAAADGGVRAAIKASAGPGEVGVWIGGAF